VRAVDRRCVPGDARLTNFGEGEIMFTRDVVSSKSFLARQALLVLVITGVMLALAATTASPASARHRPIQAMLTTVGDFTQGVVVPNRFVCTWVDLPVHDYRCTNAQGFNRLLITGPQPLLQDMGGPGLPAGFEPDDLAAPDRFRCAYDGGGVPRTPGNYTCRYRNQYGATVVFKLSEMVGVVDIDGRFYALPPRS